MMFQAILSNPNHPEYGVATIPFPITRDQYAHCMELLAALEIGDAVKADCKVTKIDSFYTVLKRAEMLTVNVEELNYLAKRLESFDTGEAAQLAENLDLFDFAPSASTPEEYGKYMIQKSGRFDYDENLNAFYERYGTERMNAEDGMFTDRGYIAYKGYISMEEVMNGGQSSHMVMGGLSR